MRKLLVLIPIAIIIAGCGEAAPENTAISNITSNVSKFGASSPFIVGHKLSTTNGQWNNSPTSFTYQWQDCNLLGEACTNIIGATGSSYILTTGDVGHTIKVVIKATNAGGSASQTSSATPEIKNVVVEESKGCNVTVSNTAPINEDLKNNSIVCLAAGSYGSISITTTPVTHGTVKAAPGAKVNVTGVNIAASNITVSQLNSTGTINVGSSSPYPGYSNDIIEHNNVGPTSGFGISILSNASTPSSFITIKGNEIHNTSTTGEGDALRLDGWNNVTVVENNIYGIKECASNTCHTDTLQSYQGEVATSNLKIEKNYTHDNVGAQGLPFLKDGDITNVVINNNLSLRNSNTNGQVTGIWVDENIRGLKITNNTYQITSGSIVQSDGSASSPTVELNHNVFDNLNIKKGSGPAYTISENYNIYTGNDEYTFSLGPNSKLESNPGFMNTATSDYRLKTNPNGIGVNWAPAEMHYGPTGE